MKIYFEQRELHYIDAEGDTFEEALANAQEMSDDDMFWEDAPSTGQIEIHWYDEEINAMLQD